MKNILICQHGGSGNHGCEALARTAIDLLRAAEPEARITLYSYSVPEDRRYLSDVEGLDIVGLDRLPGRFSPHNLMYHFKRVTGQSASKLPIDSTFRALVDAADLVVAIGGDNYCYNQGRGYWALDRFIKSRGKRYMLLGCSIEPDDLPRGLAEHLRLFDCITVRERISMDAMAAAGLENIVYIPDSAFLLPVEDTALPQGLEPGRAVGINFSPLVIQNEKTPGMTLKAFTHLARYILDSTDLQIALVPHVVWPGNDDRQALSMLKGALAGDSGRVFVLEDRPGRQLKGAIAQLRFFVGARTHATIAAYSSGVPTLTLGYSVKARGIARDLFGTESGYVVPVQGLSREDQLTEAFKALMDKETFVRGRLGEVLPGYMAKAQEVSRCFADQLKAAGRPRGEFSALAPDKDSIAGLIGKERCAGCGACAALCPEQCITARTDSEGFLQPVIDEAACTGCGACRRVCPAARPASTTEPVAAYAAATLDGAALGQATSGGVFGVLARRVLDAGGAVYGAAWGQDFSLRHIRVEHPGDLPALVGSKYVQSASGDAIADALEQLKAGRQVLFSGVTCQVNAMALVTPAALRGNLLLVDVVCHGVPSPKVLQKLKQELEAAQGAAMTGLNFRDKVSGWERSSVTATFADGAQAVNAPPQLAYMRLFLQNLSLRRSCYTCASKASPRADLTLGDFWGVRQMAPDFDRSGGASLVLVRTEQGRALLDSVSGDLRMQPVSVRGPEKYNPCITRPMGRVEGRKDFFADLDQLGLPELAKRHTKEPSMMARARRLIKK